MPSPNMTMPRFTPGSAPGRALGAMILETPPGLSKANFGETTALARMALKLRLLGKAEMRDLLRIVLSNAWDLLNDEIGDGPLAGALAMDATLGGAMGPRSPGTVLTLLYRMASQSSHGHGLRVMPEGGPDVLVKALADCVTAAGARSAPVRRSRKSWSMATASQASG